MQYHRIKSAVTVSTVSVCCEFCCWEICNCSCACGPCIWPVSVAGWGTCEYGACGWGTYDWGVGGWVVYIWGVGGWDSCECSRVLTHTGNFTLMEISGTLTNVNISKYSSNVSCCSKKFLTKAVSDQQWLRCKKCYRTQTLVRCIPGFMNGQDVTNLKMRDRWSVAARSRDSLRIITRNARVRFRLLRR